MTIVIIKYKEIKKYLDYIYLKFEFSIPDEGIEDRVYILYEKLIQKYRDIRSDAFTYNNGTFRFSSYLRNHTLVEGMLNSLNSLEKPTSKHWRPQRLLIDLQEVISDLRYYICTGPKNDN